MPRVENGSSNGAVKKPSATTPSRKALRNVRGWESVKRRLETAVQRGDLSREEAAKKYEKLRRE